MISCTAPVPVIDCVTQQVVPSTIKGIALLKIFSKQKCWILKHFTFFFTLQNN